MGRGQLLRQLVQTSQNRLTGRIGLQAHQSHKPRAPERIALGNQQQCRHRQGRSLDQCHEPLLHLLGKHRLAAAVDRSVETAQDLQTLIAEPGGITTEPPAVGGARQWHQGALLQPAGAESGCGDRQGAAGRLDPQAHTIEWSPAPQLSCQKTHGRQGAHHGGGFGGPIAGGQGQAQLTGHGRQLRRQRGTPHPDERHLLQPGHPGGVGKQPAQLGGHQGQQHGSLAHQLGRWQSLCQRHRIAHQGGSQGAMLRPPLAAAHPRQQAADVVRGQRVEVQAGRRIETLRSEPASGRRR